MSGPLTGIRVLDVSRILAAPFATQMLGDLGADVIKVERPGVGDDSRQYGPPFLTDHTGSPSDESGFYLSCNRNKRSVTVDHSTAEGAEIIRDLARESDVFIENFRSGVLKKYGLDYVGLREVNPRIVYCSITGFGQDGPYAQRPGYDGVFQAMSGMMSVSGIPDGEPGAGPMKVGVSMVDILTGLYASNAIVAALHHRDVGGGQGQYIDMSLLDCGVASLSHYLQNYLISGAAAPRRGNGGFGGIPSQTFRCSDGDDIFVVASTPKQFLALAHALGRPELVDDERFATVSARIANRDFVLCTLGAIFATRPAATWVEELEAVEVPVSPVNSMDGVFANPQVIHRQLRTTIDHPGAGPIDIVRNPIKFSDTPIDAYRVPPTLGQHTRDVLVDVTRRTHADVDSLLEQGVI
ncbi:CaiB/BaiF CoA transferase family protein [Rhodococcus erythropolis]|uniref:CaiB/BaiF CoA transferase family protein n=1 Tax=Rhodococcus erythropolis TaxID=1833 RepID=UPI0037B9D3CD